MGRVADVLKTMEYGKAPESASLANQWLDGHGRRFGLFVDGAFANVRECQRRFADYRSLYAQNKPIVRGETGVWSGDNYEPQNFGSGAATYYHKQLWAQMGDQCASEWYTAYLDQHNLWGEYLRYEQFLQGEPLTNGRYADTGSDTGAIAIANTTGMARAWGKLDATGGRGLVWIDNANDTWQRVANGQSVTPATASAEISGLPNGTYQATWFNTATGATGTAMHTVSNGKLMLSVAALGVPIVAGDSYCGNGSSTFLQNLKALFFTHLHNDHVADYPSLLLIGPGAGLGALGPLKVIGPCDRGQLDINKTGFDESRLVYTDSADPARVTPTPGIRQTTDLIWQAFAQTINDMTLDNAYPDFRSLVEVQAIGTRLPTQDSPT